MLVRIRLYQVRICVPFSKHCTDFYHLGLRGGIERGAGGRVIAAPVGVTPPPPKLGYGT